MFPAETVWQKTPWSTSSNFWQIILSEYFVQIYNTFEPWKGWTHQYEYSPKVTIFQNTIISQCCGNLFSWLISYACQGPEGTNETYSLAQHPPGPPPSLTITQQSISSRPEPPVHAPAWLWTLLNVTPTRRPMSHPSLSPSLYPGKCPMPGSGATRLPVWLLGWGLAARSCPATPGNLCTLWSCQPTQCHDNSNAKM